MSILVFPAQASQKAVAAATDEIVAAVPMPADSVLNKIWVRQSVIGLAQSVLMAALYGVDAYVIPVLDPDTAQDPDDMWDKQVPKDDAVGSDVLDLDTGTADTTPVFEPGDPSISRLLDMTTAPRRVLKRRRMLTFADRAAGFEVGTPDTFIPAETWRTVARPRTRIRVPSWLLLGVSSPGTLLTVTAFDQVANEKDWAMMQFLPHTLENMMIQLVGLTEAGAEKPYEDAATLVSVWLQQFVEETAGSFVAQTWTVFTELTASLTINGDLRRVSISAGGVV